MNTDVKSLNDIDTDGEDYKMGRMVGLQYGICLSVLAIFAIILMVPALASAEGSPLNINIRIEGNFVLRVLAVAYPFVMFMFLRIMFPKDCVLGASTNK